MQTYMYMQIEIHTYINTIQYSQSILVRR